MYSLVVVKRLKENWTLRGKVSETVRKSGRRAGTFELENWTGTRSFEVQLDYKL